ncbi:MAG: hypothetical protein N838_27125 [Thiohalocapsa sp. PB-PSB1]|nr:MAG: hypothetical protein N838_27125 [Thiohalocapsa sp. PB-PSB1]
MIPTTEGQVLFILRNCTISIGFADTLCDSLLSLPKLVGKNLLLHAPVLVVLQICTPLSSFESAVLPFLPLVMSTGSICEILTRNNRIPTTLGNIPGISIFRDNPIAGGIDAVRPATSADLLIVPSARHVTVVSYTILAILVTAKAIIGILNSSVVKSATLALINAKCR